MAMLIRIAGPPETNRRTRLAAYHPSGRVGLPAQVSRHSFANSYTLGRLVHGAGGRNADTAEVDLGGDVGLAARWNDAYGTPIAAANQDS